jgi:hypothetical protein
VRAPWLLGRVTIPWDAKAHFLPQVQFLAASLAKGQAPSWAPFVFSGHPQIADPQALIFSPPYAALALLDAAPTAWAVDATLIAMVFVGSLALLTWCLDRGWHWVGGLIAALAFGFGGAMAWRVQHTDQVLSLAYLPLAMLCLDRALARRSLVYAAALGCVVALMIAGRDQVALVSLYFLAALAVARVVMAQDIRQAARGAARPLFVAAPLAAALAALPVILTYALSLASNRPSIDFSGAGRGSLHPALLLTLLTPDLFSAAGPMADYWGPPSFAWPGTDLFLAQNMGVLYLGAIPLLALALAALRGELWDAEIRPISIAAIVVLVYALGWYTPLFRVLYALLPAVDLFRRPADATFLLGALLALLAGYAGDRLLTRSAPLARGHKVVVAALFAAALLLALALAVWRARTAVALEQAAIAVVSFALAGLILWASRALIGSTPLLAGGLVCAALTLDLGVLNGQSTSTALPPAAYDVLSPTSHNETIAALRALVVRNEVRRDRIELAGLGFEWPNASLTHGLENTLGYNPIRLSLYSAAAGADDHVGLPEQRRFTPLFPSYRSTLANLLGLRFIATGVPIETIDSKLEPGALPLVARTRDGYIYENPRAAPRVSFAARAERADFDAMLRDGVWPSADLASTVLLEDAPLSPPRPGPVETGTVRIVAYENTRVVVDAVSEAGGFVVLNDVWHPWWFADVDGAPAKLLRANVLFRAVAVPPGRHRVGFAFRPLAGVLAALRAAVSR